MLGDLDRRRQTPCWGFRVVKGWEALLQTTVLLLQDKVVHDLDLHSDPSPTPRRQCGCLKEISPICIYLGRGFFFSQDEWSCQNGRYIDSLCPAAVWGEPKPWPGWQLRRHEEVAGPRVVQSVQTVPLFFILVFSFLIHFAEEPNSVKDLPSF